MEIIQPILLTEITHIIDQMKKGSAETIDSLVAANLNYSAISICLFFLQLRNVTTKPPREITIPAI